MKGWIILIMTAVICGGYRQAAAQYGHENSVPCGGHQQAAGQPAVRYRHDKSAARAGRQQAVDQQAVKYWHDNTTPRAGSRSANVQLYPLAGSAHTGSGLAASQQDARTSLYSFSPAAAHRPDPIAIYPRSTPPMPGEYYQQHFGFFCKTEWNWEKQTRIPLKLRLGSYQYAQMLEGK